MAILCVEKVKAEKKLAPTPTSRLQDVPATRETLASHLPPTDETMGAGPPSEPQLETEVINPEPNVRYFLFLYLRCPFSPSATFRRRSMRKSPVSSTPRRSESCFLPPSQNDVPFLQQR